MARVQQTGQKRKLGGGAPQPGTTEHATAMLVLIELALLYLIRRQFKSAHGG